MTPLRIAIPKGRLQTPSLALFEKAGYPVPDAEDLASRALRMHRAGVEWIFVRDADVPVYIEHGAADVGIAGADQLEEQQAAVHQPLDLPFGRCNLMLIGKESNAGPVAGQRTRIATKYPVLARSRLGSRASLAEVVTLQGSVELALVLGLSDYIVDLVETGATIRANKLEPLEVLMEICPRVAVNRESFRFKRTAVRELLDRLQTVLASCTDVAEAGGAR